MRVAVKAQFVSSILDVAYQLRETFRYIAQDVERPSCAVRGEEIENLVGIPFHATLKLA